jgi:hypothetical protein
VQKARPQPTSLLLALGEFLGGQAPPRCLVAQSHRSSVEVARGARPLAPGAQEPHLHPPRHRCGDGDVNLCELQNASKQHLHLSELQSFCVSSYKEVLLGRMDSGRQRNSSPPSGEVRDARMLDSIKEGSQAVKKQHPRPSTTLQTVSEADRQQEHRSFYLRKMKGLYFNCLPRDHKVAS